MQSKERIKSIFTHAQPDRIGVFDFFEDITITNWKKQGLLPNNIDIYDLFDFDLDFRKDKQNKNKFTILSLEGPFQQMIAKKGLQQALMDFSRETRHTKDFFKDTLSNIFSEYRKHKEKGLVFDGIWLYEDIAYDNGLYFSFKKYEDTLFDFHKEISSYFQNENRFVIFHCDGNIEQLLPFLVKAKFSSVHPIQESCNPNIFRIKKDLKTAITFIGAVSANRIKGYHQDILDRIGILKEGGDYIFCFDAPIPPDTEFRTYENLFTKIEEAGIYK